MNNIYCAAPLNKIVYCAIPSRLVNKDDRPDNLIEIISFVTSQGCTPLHPFQIPKYKRYEMNQKKGEMKCMEWGLKLMDMSDEVWMFGISKGTLEEFSHAVKLFKPVSLKLDFDHEWEKFYQKLEPKYENSVLNAELYLMRLGAEA